MEQSQHSYNSKKQLNQALYRAIYGPIRQRMSEDVDKIIMDNTNLHKYPHRHFIYKGNIYHMDPFPLPMRKNPLDPSLYARMDAYLKELDELNQYEIPLIQNFITMVLNSTNHFCDYYKILPDIFHKTLDEFKKDCICSNHNLSNPQIENIKLVNKKVLDKIYRRSLLNSFE